MGKKLVSFSLYGTEPMYLDGMVENAKLMKSIYPGWQLRVYAEDTTEVQTLQSLGAEIVHMGQSHDQSGMLWRFLPAWEKDVERVIFRDADSRINHKEAAAVKAWIDSGLDAHCMHDHPHHYCLPIMGGMWGIKGGVLPCMMIEWARYMAKMARRVSDMKLLRDTILPHIKDSLLRHSSYDCEWPYQPFPKHQKIEGFVGQQINNEGERIWA
jgi:hypothetical protein